ncbi:MAG: carboxynorspermidine decarboxylase [Prevotellaceae bacterium]|jgi:carboxynorspermidine decarboxylase|nr:carboxynorspermidine decarboxylase [Prevotellaceae bacterium]
MIDNKIPSPCYVIEEDLLRKNLALIKSVAERADVEIIVAFKAFAMWKTFPIFREYGFKISTASSLAEARLAFEEMGSRAHTYAPVYQEVEFDEICGLSSHITFNSLSQYEKYKCQVTGNRYQVTNTDNPLLDTPHLLPVTCYLLPNSISCGFRINPEVSVVETDLYNPAKAGSRLGIIADLLPEILPKGIEGLHFHALCESTSYDLEKVLDAVEQKFSKYFPQIKWLNFGGGHLMTHKDYDVEHLIKILTNFKQKYPHLKIILEPGAAFVWQTGFLKATVEDIVENHGIKTAMLNISFACHLPDCLEMPYKPAVRGEAATVGAGRTLPLHKYRFGGNSCLSGDFFGDFYFEKPLEIGQEIIFEDMIHYTMVKTTMFNGVSHPSIGILKSDGNFELFKHFSYEDYKNRMC